MARHEGRGDVDNATCDERTSSCPLAAEVKYETVGTLTGRPNDSEREHDAIIELLTSVRLQLTRSTGLCDVDILIPSPRRCPGTCPGPFLLSRLSHTNESTLQLSLGV